jgi:hypothetical protein
MPIAFTEIGYLKNTDSVASLSSFAATTMTDSLSINSVAPSEKGSRLQLNTALDIGYVLEFDIEWKGGTGNYWLSFLPNGMDDKEENKYKRFSLGHWEGQNDQLYLNLIDDHKEDNATYHVRIEYGKDGFYVNVTCPSFPKDYQNVINRFIESKPPYTFELIIRTANDGTISFDIKNITIK